jgi:hypothetical protein
MTDGNTFPVIVIFHHNQQCKEQVHKIPKTFHGCVGFELRVCFCFAVAVWLCNEQYKNAQKTTVVQSHKRVKTKGCSYDFMP